MASEQEAHERIARLPRWAQNYIDKIRNENASLKRHIAEAETSHEPTNVKLSSFYPYEDWGLPRDAEINFYMDGTSEKWKDMISVAQYENNSQWVRIAGDGRHHGLLVRAMAANWILVRNSRD